MYKSLNLWKISTGSPQAIVVDILPRTNMSLMPIGEPERSQTLNTFVKQTLRYRKIARPNGSEPLSGVYLEIYEVLQTAVGTYLESSVNLTERLTTEVIQGALTSCYPKVLTHARITQLAIALQKQAPRTAERAYAQRELFAAIYASQKLVSAQILRVPERFYDDIVQEILMAWGVQRIQNFDPTRSAFMTWINNQLKWKKSDVMARLSSVHEVSADFRLEGSNETLNSTEPPLGDFLKACAEGCDHGECQSIFDKHMRHRPEATFRAIFDARILQGQTWREIGIQFGSNNLSGLEHFIKRNMPKIIPCLRNCMEDKVSLWHSQH